MRIKGIREDQFPVDVCYNAYGFWGGLLHGIYRRAFAFINRWGSGWTLVDAFNEGYTGFAINIGKSCTPITKLFHHKLKDTSIIDILDTMEVLAVLNKRKVDVLIYWRPGRGFEHFVEYIEKELERWKMLKIKFQRV